MANDRETKSYEQRPDRRPDYRKPVERSKETGERLTRGGAGGTMSGNRDADRRPHGESGSSGVGLPPDHVNMPGGGRIYDRENLDEK